jgi:hypothetical protein
MRNVDEVAAKLLGAPYGSLGSEFVVTLPTADAPPAAASAPIEARSRTGRRVLLVEEG